MEIITSLDNNKIKNIIKLKDKKYRDEQQLYIAEGVRWVFDALENENASQFILSIVLSETSYEIYKNNLKSVIDKVIVVSETIMNKISLLASCQGVLAVMKQNFSTTSNDINGNYCLFLDRIRDPGNMGTIIRTALAAGFKNIFCSSCVDVYNPKVIQSCMSAILNVKIFICDNAMLDKLKKDDFFIISGDLNGSNLFSLNFSFKNISSNKFCLVIGNEAEGITYDIKAKSDMLVKIPMENIESLNAAVSGGILMYFIKFINFTGAPN